MGSVIRRLLPSDGGVDLQHLRRFAKARDVPEVVRDAFGKARDSAQKLSATALEGLISGNTPILAQGQEVIAADVQHSDSVDPSAQADVTTAASIATRREPGKRTESTSPGDLFLIIGSTNAISSAAAAEEISAVVNNPVIFSIQVPRLAPTSQEQAASWSSQYWPTVYKKSNPFGPHPSIVSRTEQQIRGEVGKWMDLAFEVAHQAEVTGSGEVVGVVIVERKDGVGRPVAVAGDARWKDWPCKGPGNVTAHAALRVIAMVAAGVKAFNESEQSTGGEANSSSHPGVEAEPADQFIGNGELEFEKSTAGKVVDTSIDSSQSASQPNTDVAFTYIGEVKGIDGDDIFQDKPILAAEKEHYDPSGTTTGYLCHDLEIYCTHEPCVMCSMAILHSRFGKVIFQHRMPKTGGLCAEGDLGHGLFWRKELNWTLLAWQWRIYGCDGEVEGGDFHA